MVTRHQDRRCRCGTGVRDMYVHRKLPSAHSSMCVLKAALCVHAACVEVARGVYSTSLVVCGGCDIGATVEERLSLFSLNRTRLMPSYHVKSFIPPIRKSSRRAASMRPTQNVEPHQACTYKLLHNKEAQPRRGHVTRTKTDTSTARATRCARPMRAPSDRRRPRGSMPPYTCVYQARV